MSRMGIELSINMRTKLCDLVLFEFCERTNLRFDDIWSEGCLHPENLEDFESELQAIAYQIRDFRMKNFPESEDINE